MLYRKRAGLGYHNDAAGGFTYMLSRGGVHGKLVDHDMRRLERLLESLPDASDRGVQPILMLGLEAEQHGLALEVRREDVIPDFRCRLS